MADDRSNRGAPDNQRIDTNDANELRNWSKSLGATPDQIKDAVNKVGTSADKVRQYLRGK
jgi:hypothetical protein